MCQRISSVLIPLAFAALFLLPGRVSGEKLFLATDRDVYVAGDRLFFALHLTNGSGETSDYGYITLTGLTGNHVSNGFLKFEENLADGSIYLPDTLVSGIYQLIAFTNEMRNEGSASFARKNLLIINRFEKQLPELLQSLEADHIQPLPMKPGTPELPGIILDTDQFRQRENFFLTIQIPDAWRSKKFTLSVRQKAPVTFPDIEPDVKNPPRNFDCQYLPEKTGVILQGRLVDENLSPAQNRAVFLSCVDTAANLQYTLSGSGGMFRFFLNPGYFGKTIVIKSDNQFKGSIETDDPYMDLKPASPAAVSISGDLFRFLENSQKFLTIQKSYHPNYLKTVKIPVSAKEYIPKVYHQAPQVVYPSDYVFLPDFIEISREILPFMKTRENDEGYEGSIVNLDRKKYTSMFIFVDGILIEDVNQIISFHSGITRKIEIVPQTRFLGKLSIPSILSIFTTSREIDRLSWKYPMAKLKTGSLLDHSAFTPPASGEIPRNIPDFRPLLLWEPDLDLSRETTLRFSTNTSDCTGEFEIVVTCPDNEGNKVEFKRYFTVNHN